MKQKEKLSSVTILDGSTDPPQLYPLSKTDQQQDENERDEQKNTSQLMVSRNHCPKRINNNMTMKRMNKKDMQPMVF